MLAMLGAVETKQALLEIPVRGTPRTRGTDDVVELGICEDGVVGLGAESEDGYVAALGIGNVEPMPVVDLGKTTDGVGADCLQQIRGAYRDRQSHAAAA
jgi:hypothetical protein